MKTLWVVNGILPQIAQLEGSAVQAGATWLVSVADALMREADASLFVLYRGDSATASGTRASGTRASGASASGASANGALRYAAFQDTPGRYSEQNEMFFYETLLREKPDVVHVWGTEYASALEMLRASARAGLLNRTVVSIQGLCSIYAAHYTAGLPARVVYGATFRDFVRRDNIALQKRAFARRGAHEMAALRMTRHVAGRTDWDYAAAKQLNPAVCYHKLNETLRPAFFSGAWSPDACDRHTLFLPQSYYPIKGTHRALETLSILRRAYPDAKLVTTGDDPRRGGFSARLRRSSYARYLAERIRALELDDAVQFLGVLDAEEMKAAYLRANVCLSPSSVENSPNGVGEAMLLGTPVVSSFVGGVSSILTHGAEGLLYPADAPYLAAEYAARIFGDDACTLRLSNAARARARETHDPASNLAALKSMYESLTGGA